MHWKSQTQAQRRTITKVSESTTVAAISSRPRSLSTRVSNLYTKKVMLGEAGALPRAPRGRSRDTNPALSCPLHQRGLLIAPPLSSHVPVCLVQVFTSATSPPGHLSHVPIQLSAPVSPPQSCLPAQFQTTHATHPLQQAPLHHLSQSTDSSPSL